MSDLAALLERVKKATTADRELDVRLWAEFEGRDVREAPSFMGERSLLARNRKPPNDECVLGAFGAKGARFLTVQGSECPRYTASIDAALVLVEKQFPGEERFVWRLQTDFGGLKRMTITLDDVTAPTKWQADGATPPLAILAALLQAKLAEPQP